MKAIYFLAELTFFEKAKEAFNFPIKNSIRTSFWIPSVTGSTFSELTFNEEITETLKLYYVKILLVEREFFKDKIIPDTEFRLGTFPIEIASGKIIEMLESQ